MFRKKTGEELTIDSPEQALNVVSEIRVLTEQLRRIPGMEEGKIEEIEREEDRIIREYSEMNPRRPTRFIRELSDLATSIQSAHDQGILSEKQVKLLELMVKKTKIRDFYAARKLLIKFSKGLDMKKERDHKLDSYRSYQRRTEAKGRELRAEIARLKNIPMPERSPEELAAVKHAFEEYNEASSSALADFFAHSPCIEAIPLALEASRNLALGFPAPKSPESVNALLKVLHEEDVKKAFGGERLGKLVEAAGYSEKRLEHFVKDYKWFQRQLQENAIWLSELTAARSEALRIAWQDSTESLRNKVETFATFLRRLPRSDWAVQALTNLAGLVQTGEYDIALRTEAIYKSHGESAASKFRGSLAGDIEKLEAELADIQSLMAKLPAPDKLLAR